MEIEKEIDIDRKNKYEEKFWAYLKVLKAGMTSKRFQHSLAVAETAEKLAGFWGADPEKAWLAGVFHDCAREFTRDQLRNFALAQGIVVLEEEKDNPVVLHAPVGALLVQKEFGISDPEILSAIAKHTVGGKDLTLLDKIIYLADLIEINRKWPGVEILRGMVYQDLDQALKFALEGTIKFLKEKGQPIHPDTLAAYISLRNKAKTI